jgi:translocator protein
MGEIASKDQLRMSYLRWALVCVPGMVFLGFLSGRIANSGYDNPWFDALTKPGFMPPGWVFPVAWTLLYILMGLALAMILDARSAKGRGVALGLFGAQFLLNLIWSPLFFAAHKVVPAFFVILGMLILAGAAAWAFSKIRKQAAWLMIPYLLWLCFASALNWEIHRLNPDADRFVPPSEKTEIQF